MIVFIIAGAEFEMETINLSKYFLKNPVGIVFLIAFMGWMPAPLDVSVWHSIWTVGKKENFKKLFTKEFNV